jgi:Ca2+-binding RTX toxin-like protein
MSIIGTKLNDVLTGTPGDDTIDGGAGLDTMKGGAGNDTYVVGDTGDIVVEEAGAGTDTVAFKYVGTDIVFGSAEYSLPDNVENLTFANYPVANILNQITGNGNALDNVITGSVSSYTGDSTFDDLTRNTLSGGGGNDVLIGAAYGDGLDGGDGNDTLRGMTGNDTLNGGVGADQLIGGAGDDLYQMLDDVDQITERSGEGNDTVRTSLNDYTLAANVENLILTGVSAVIGNGNDLPNVLQGEDTLTGRRLNGGAGDDTLMGGWAISDTLAGGSGNDVYRLNSVEQLDDLVIEEAGGGTDDVYANVLGAKYGACTVPAGVENFTLSGDYGFGTILGNDLDNVLTVSPRMHVDYSNMTRYGNGYYYTGADDIQGAGGNDTLYGTYVADTLSGGEGDDVFFSGGGNDVLKGDAGADTYNISSGNGQDLLQVDSQDTIAFDASLAYADLKVGLLGLSGAGKVVLGLKGTDAITLDSAGSWDGLTLKFADGKAVTGQEIMALAAWPAGQVINGTLGDDILTGLAGDDTITGLAGNDKLDGGLGADQLTGGAGDDVYYLDQAKDQVTEDAGGGNDTVVSEVDYTLSDFLENLVLSGPATEGFGNGLSNVLKANGNGLGSTLHGGGGNDTLVGSAKDVLSGDDGNDFYELSSISYEADSLTHVYYPATAAVNEAADQGFDEIRLSQYLFGFGYYLPANVEKLTLGTGNAGMFVGNNLDNTMQAGDDGVVLAGQDGQDTVLGGQGADSLYGDAGADVLVGGAGNDQLSGGEGADTYRFSKGFGQDSIYADGQDAIVLDAAMARGDLIIGRLGATAADTVVLSFKGSTDSITLNGTGQWNELKLSFADGSILAGADILAEASKPLNLTINGTVGKDRLTGGAGNDTLTGLAGNDTLAGGLGADKLIGGKGNDTYLFNRGDGKDTIVDTDSTWFNADLLKVGSAKSNQLWLTKSGNNLDIGIIGTQDHVVIQDWYLSSNNRVEKITALGDNKSLSASKVNALVSAMAKFSAPAEGVTALPAATQTSLTKILASSWA